MRRVCSVVLLASVVACSGSSDAPPADAGVQPDATTHPRDGGTSDAGIEDAGADRDGGPRDGGLPPLAPVVVDVTAPPPALLSQYNFFRVLDGVFDYNARVVPYDLSTALFSDFALKDRAIYVPEGQSMTYDERDAFAFPVGSAIVKTFSFAPDLSRPTVDRRLLETRVMVRTADGWETYPYRWNAEGTDADYFVRGRVETITLTDPNGEMRTAQYLIPQKNQCVNCHELQDDAQERYLTPIGPKARHLNRDGIYDGAPVNQLTHLADLKMLTGLPPIADVPSAFDLESLRGTSTTSLSFETLERAARDYLDINCAHCHNAAGTNGQTSRLYLDAYNDNDFNLGFCKEPGSAGTGAGGRRFDIVPGSADASIMSYRIETETVGDMMPLIGRSLRHDLGAAIVRAWIDGLPPVACD